MTQVRSNILVHWTGGNDIETQPEDQRPRLYVERLKDYLDHGLYAPQTEEDAVRGLKVKRIVRLCFTELRLSQSATHTRRFGKLGIGFRREFILRKGGRPVIYVSHKLPQDGVLEDAIVKAYKLSKGHEEQRRAMTTILGHVKRMSDGKDKEYFEEMEWRLVHDGRVERPAFLPDATKKGVHRMRFAVVDCELIIVPDETTKLLVSEQLRDYFVRCLPTIVTLETCKHF